MYIYICMYVCMYVCISIYMHTYIHGIHTHTTHRHKHTHPPPTFVENVYRKAVHKYISLGKRALIIAANRTALLIFVVKNPRGRCTSPLKFLTLRKISSRPNM